MSKLSDYLEEGLLNQVFNTVTLTPPATMYVALYTATPTDTGGAGGTEVSGSNAYARTQIYKQAVTNTPGWAVANATTTKFKVTNANTVTFPTATASWGDVKAMAIFSHLTTGDMMVFGALTATKTVNSGDTFKFASSNLTVTLE